MVFPLTGDSTADASVNPELSGCLFPMSLQSPSAMQGDEQTSQQPSSWIWPVLGRPALGKLSHCTSSWRSVQLSQWPLTSLKPVLVAGRKRVHLVWLKMHLDCLVVCSQHKLFICHERWCWDLFLSFMYFFFVMKGNVRGSHNYIQIQVRLWVLSQHTLL